MTARRRKRGHPGESTGEAMTGERQTVSILQACEQVGVSRRTIYNWIARGKVEYVRTAGGSVRIFSDTLWRSPEKHRPPAGPRLSLAAQ